MVGLASQPIVAEGNGSAAAALTLGASLVSARSLRRPPRSRHNRPRRTQPAPAIAPAQIDLEKDTQSSALADVPAAPAEAPPPPPYKKSVVIDSSIGALVFLGKFGKTAPPAPWLRTQVGYELFKWLMLFGEGELGFTDTSRLAGSRRRRARSRSSVSAAALRLTVRFTDRFGVYLQGSLGAMKADIRTNALGIIGFRDAERLRPLRRRAPRRGVVPARSPLRARPQRGHAQRDGLQAAQRRRRKRHPPRLRCRRGRSATPSDASRIGRRWPKIHVLVSADQ